MSIHTKKYRSGLPWGLTTITKETDQNDNTGIRFSILRIKAGRNFSHNSSMELALLHLDGEASFDVDGTIYKNSRSSLFEDSPFTVHAPAGTPIAIHTETDTEIALIETRNSQVFPTQVHLPENVTAQHIGQGLVDGASHYLVRNIFDGSNSHENAQLVLGEVVNFPGRWSSYPPYHHPQPGMNHYRFTDPKGYGHAELGEEVLKVKSFDTVKIINGVDHAQCAAPGYGMYYFYVIRHLEEMRYTAPELAKDHSWALDPTIPFWKPEIVSI